ncbi:helix-turn-helix domain-containing protein [Sulfurospirillum sp. 1612]|uniref:helix-turn-helix domain-containing protein n=1 Tax=Sulfurospirillum sp. 1612 TaxID=3094835 RepID=UPI002F929622
MIDVKLIDKFENGRTTVENDILLNTSLTATEKIVYMYIEMLSYKDNYCYATNRQICDLTGHSIDALKQAIKKLKKKKYIVIDTLQTRTPYKRRIFTETRFLKAWNSATLPSDCTVKNPIRRIEELDRLQISKSFAKFRKFMKLYLTENQFFIDTAGDLQAQIIEIKKNGYYRTITYNRDLNKDEAILFEMLMFDKREALLDAFFKNKELKNDY